MSDISFSVEHLRNLKANTIYNIVLLITLLLPANCIAQERDIHNCDGRWTNLPCDQVGVPATSRRVLSPEEAKARSQKDSILHELRMKTIEAERKYQVVLSLTTIEAFCDDNSTSVESCRKEAERTDDRLDRKINSAILIRQKEVEINRRKEPAPTQAPTTIIIKERYQRYRPNVGYPNQSGSSITGNGQVQGQGQQIQQNIIIQRPVAPPTVAPTPRVGVSTFKTEP